MNKINFRKIKHKKDLANILSINENLLQRLSKSKNKFFEEHFIPKAGKNRGFRQIWKILDSESELDNAYKNFSRLLGSSGRRPKSVVLENY